MRVALIATASFDYCVEYAEMLAEFCEVLFCAPDKSIADRAFIDPRVEIAPFRWPRHRSPANLFLVAKLLVRIRAWRPDIVHFLGENNIWLNLLPPLMGRIPVVTTVHDIELSPRRHGISPCTKNFHRSIHPSGRCCYRSWRVPSVGGSSKAARAVPPCVRLPPSTPHLLPASRGAQQTDAGEGWILPRSLLRADLRV